MLLDPNIIGHQSTQRDLLRSVVDHRFAHAHLFVGARGIGKRLVAQALAKALTCQDRSASGVACHACHSCKMNELGTHADVAFFERDKSNYSVQHLRDNVIDWAARRPREGNLKVGILDSVERLGSASANAFLKTLEEPPAGTKWILLSSDLAGVLTTVISRSRLVHFASLKDSEVEALTRGPLAAGLREALAARAELRPSSDQDDEESAGLSPAEHAFALALAQGSPGRYLEVLSDDLITRRDWLIERLLGRDERGPVGAADAFLETHKRSSDATQEPMRERLLVTLDLMGALLRDLTLLSRDSATRLINADATSRLKRAVKRYDALLAEGAADRLADLARLVGRNVSPRLIAVNALFALEECLRDPVPQA